MLRLRQSHEYVGAEGIHQWQCRFELSGSTGELERVDHVDYTLDPSFPNPVRNVRDRTSCFALDLLCWASFTLYATVRYRDGTEDYLANEVVLDLPAEVKEGGADTSNSTPQEQRFEPPVLSTDEADLVLDGGGVRAIAFAGALEAAEEMGVERWVDIVGSSAGALVAVLLAAGYRPPDISRLLLDTNHVDVFRWRAGGLMTRLGRSWSNSGTVSPKRLRAWLEQLLERSPLGTPKPTFGELAARQGSRGASTTSRHRLRIIVSDLTAARMIVLPDDVEDYEDDQCNSLVGDDFPVVDAVLMSMCVPIWFKPVELRRNGAIHYMVDGGLLSNFPVWLFDAPYPSRPTWGVRLRTESTGELATEPPTNLLKLALALTRAVVEAAREVEPARNATRTLTITVPSVVGPTLRKGDNQVLRDAGYQAGRAFFASRGTYLNSLGRGLSDEALSVPQAVDLRRAANQRPDAHPASEWP